MHDHLNVKYSFYFKCTSTTMMHKIGSTACLRPTCGSGENYKVLPLKLQRAFYYQLLIFYSISLHI